MSKCIFAGSFDPFTKGHEAIVRKCLKMFDEIVIAITINPNKKSFFSLEDRKSFIEKLYGKHAHIKVITWEGLAVDLMEQEAANVWVRGVRNSIDYEYETSMYHVNSQLSPGFTTIYIPANQGTLHISSSTVRELLRLGKTYLPNYLPEEIVDEVDQLVRLGSKNS